jgi:hypothetical protein
MGGLSNSPTYRVSHKVIEARHKVLMALHSLSKWLRVVLESPALAPQQQLTRASLDLVGVSDRWSAPASTGWAR